MNTKSLIWGIFFIAIGITLLGVNLNFIDFYWDDIWAYWPMAMIAGGILFFLGWAANRTEYGLLMPAAILTTYGIIFYYCMEYGWWMMDSERLWAFFIVGPGLGFLLMYLLGNRDKGLLTTGLILLGVGFAFWIELHELRRYWPLLLILIGIRMLMKHRESLKKDDGDSKIASSTDNG